MKQKIRQHDTPISYKGMLGRMYMTGKDYVTLAFDGLGMTPITLTNFELGQAINKSLFFVQDKQAPNIAIGNLSPTELIEQQRRNAYLNAVKENGCAVGGKKLRERVISEVSEKINDLEPPCISTLGKWAKLEVSIIGGVTAKRKLIKKRKSQFCESIISLALAVTDEYILQEVPMSVQYAYDKFRARCIGLFDNVPCLETFRKWFTELIAPEDIIKTQNNRSERRKAMRNAIAKHVTKHPLQRVEADGVYIPVGIVDDEGNYLGGVTIIILLDVHTRYVLGYELQIGRGEPSSTIISAIRHSVCVKDEGSFHTFTSTHWHFGIPALLVLDGGSGFTSQETFAYTHNYCGTKLEVLPSASPWLKPYIERFNLSCKEDWGKALPGNVGGISDQQKQSMTMKQKAVLTIDEFRRSFEAWVVDQYHNTPHSGLKQKTPNQAWQEAMNEGFIPEIPVDEDRVKLPSGQTCTRKVSGDVFHQGVVINNIRYNDDAGELKNIAMQLALQNEEPTVQCYYSTTDVSAISVLNPFTQDVFLVTTIDPAIYKGMSLAEYQAKEVKTYSNKGFGHKRGVDDNPEIVAANARLAKKEKQKKSIKSRPVKPHELENKINALNGANREVNSKTPTPTKTDGSDDYNPNDVSGHDES
jgi:putative transposase